jgi:hypothetical protein
MNLNVETRNGYCDTDVASRFSSLLTAHSALFTSSAPLFPALRSSHELSQWPLFSKQFSSSSHLFYLLLISLLTLIPSLVFGTGLAAIKEQSFHDDAGANIVVYTTLKDSGTSVKIEMTNRSFTIEPKQLAGKLEVISALPANITTETELEPVRKSAKEYRDFSTRFPKSALVLSSYITAMETCIKEFEGGKGRYNGKWMPKEEALAARQKVEQTPSEAEAAFKQKREERLAFKKEAEAALKKKREEKLAFEKSQHAKGLLEYDGKWIPEVEARKLLKERADAKADAEEIAKNTRRLQGRINQIVDGGMVVFAHYGNEGRPVFDSGKDRPQVFYGDVFLVGHPEISNKADNDWFDVDAVYLGTKQFKTVLGAVRTLKKFQVIKSYY